MDNKREFIVNPKKNKPKSMNVIMLVDFKNKKHDVIGEVTEGLDHKSIDDVMNYYCKEYHQELLNGKDIFLAKVNEDGTVRPIYRGQYAEWLVEETKGKEQYYIDVAEDGDRYIFFVALGLMDEIEISDDDI